MRLTALLLMVLTPCTAATAQAAQVHFRFGVTREAEACWERGGVFYYRAQGRTWQMPKGDVEKVEGSCPEPEAGIMAGTGEATAGGASQRPPAAAAPATARSSPSGLTPQQEKALEEVRQMVKETLRIYHVLSTVEVSVASWVGAKDLSSMGGIGIVYTGGRFYLAPGLLGSPNRDAFLASALAYHILRTPSEATSLAGYTREEGQRMMDANAKAVEILGRVRGWPEQAALHAVYYWLFARHRAWVAGHRASGAGQVTPCDEIRDLLGRYPQRRDWWGTLECAPS